MCRVPLFVYLHTCPSSSSSSLSSCNIISRHSSNDEHLHLELYIYFQSLFTPFLSLFIFFHFRLLFSFHHWIISRFFIFPSIYNHHTIAISANHAPAISSCSSIYLFIYLSIVYSLQFHVVLCEKYYSTLIRSLWFIRATSIRVAKPQRFNQSLAVPSVFGVTRGSKMASRFT